MLTVSRIKDGMKVKFETKNWCRKEEWFEIEFTEIEGNIKMKDTLKERKDEDWKNRNYMQRTVWVCKDIFMNSFEFKGDLERGIKKVFNYLLDEVEIGKW